jgi:predicted nucleic acid-binding protein
MSSPTPRKLTIDASVYLAALEKGSGGASDARAFLRQVLSEGYEVYLPRLFLLELTVALRAMLNTKSIYALLARQWAIAENVRWLDQDGSFTRAACELAEQGELRVSDAVYAMTARVSGGVLVSLDPAMIEKASSHVSVLTPASFIGRDSTTAQPGFAENQSGDLSQ